MKRIFVKAENRYLVSIGDDYVKAIKQIEQEHNQVLILIPQNLRKFVKLPTAKNVHILALPNGEAQKNIESANRVWRELGKRNFSRQDCIVAVGGGATTDLAGFVAATWLRGITWYAIPTSLAAMVDAAIGGKTGINAASGKNLIGSFYSPRKVILDLKFLQTLPERDISAGMAEVIKSGFIWDSKILSLLESDVLDFEQIIYRTIKVKSKVVGRDFKESKLREILNYGHTLGHAIEKDSKYRLRHGEAVAIGLVFAAELSQILGGLSNEVVERHRDLLKSFNLPIVYPKSKLPTLIKIMQADKKVKAGRIRFIGLSGVGKPIWLEEVSKADIAKAYERITR
jgi:3-dehydroquinate synthase